MPSTPVAIRHRQTIAPQGLGVLRLPVSKYLKEIEIPYSISGSTPNTLRYISPYFRLLESAHRKVGTGRDIKFISVIMSKIGLILGVQGDGSNLDAMIQIIQNGVSSGVDTAGFDPSTATDAASLDALILARCATYATVHSLDSITKCYVLPSDLPVARSFSTPSLALNTARQASTTRDALVVASVEIDASLSLTTGAKGTITFQYADDSGFTTNVVSPSFSVNGNTGTLVIGLNTVGNGGGNIVGVVPAGKYYRLHSVNTTGTPTYGTPTIQEVLL